MAVADAGVLVTATHGTDQSLVRTVLGGASLTPAARGSGGPVAPTEPSATSTAATVPVPGTYRGKGFDACTAPSSSTMQAWLSSPYRAVGVYIGGIMRACSQPNLTSAWVSEQVSEGF